MISSKFNDWQLKVLSRSSEVVLLYNDVEKKRYAVSRFIDDGMRILPKPLYKEVGSDIKLANIYDKFMDKLFEHYDPD